MATRTAGRIVLPTNPDEVLNLAQKVYDKHQADGAASPLNAQSDFNWATEGPKIVPCRKNNKDAAEAAKLAEKLYRERDKDLNPITAILKNSAALLKTIYAKNPKVLGDYGFVVDDTPRVKKPKP